MKTTKSKNNKWNIIVEMGIVSGAATFFSTLLMIMYWHRDGFDELELIIISFIAGICLFSFILLFNHILLKPYLIKKYSKNQPIPKRKHLLLLIPVISFTTYLLMDSLLFLVDKSISKDYLSSLGSFLDENTDNDIYPLAYLNSIVTLIFGFLGSLFSTPRVKNKGYDPI